MKNYFYAYHSDNNRNEFDCKSGYGVSEAYKEKRVNVGDFVFVIQKIKEKYELCGLFEVTEKRFSSESRLPYRMELKDKSELPFAIELNEDELSQQLPPLDYKYKWNNFKKHFCRQAVSFQNTLNEDVVRILNAIIENEKQTITLKKKGFYVD